MEKRLLKAQQMAKVANFEFDVVQNCYTYTSDTLFEIFGLNKTLNTLLPRSFFGRLVHPDDLAMVEASILKS